MKSPFKIALGLMVFVFLMIALWPKGYHPLVTEVDSNLSLTPLIVTEASRDTLTKKDLEFPSAEFGSPIGPQSFELNHIKNAINLIVDLQSIENPSTVYLKSLILNDDLWESIIAFDEGGQSADQQVKEILRMLLPELNRIVYRKELLDLDALTPERFNFEIDVYGCLFDPSLVDDDIDPINNELFIHRFNRLIIENRYEKAFIRTSNLSFLFDFLKRSNNKCFEEFASNFFEDGYKYYQVAPSDVVLLTLSTHYNTKANQGTPSKDLVNTSQLRLPIRYTTSGTLSNQEMLFLSYFSGPYITLNNSDNSFIAVVKNFIDRNDHAIWNNMISPTIGMLRVQIPYDIRNENFYSSQIQIEGRIYETFLNTPFSNSEYFKPRTVFDSHKFDLAFLRGSLRFQTNYHTDWKGGNYENFFNTGVSNQNSILRNSAWYDNRQIKHPKGFDLKISLQKNAVSWEDEDINWSLLEWEKSGIYGYYIPEVEYINLQGIDYEFFNEYGEKMQAHMRLNSSDKIFKILYTSEESATVEIIEDNGGLRLVPKISKSKEWLLHYSDLMKLNKPHSNYLFRPYVGAFKQTGWNRFLNVVVDSKDPSVVMSWSDISGLLIDRTETRFFNRHEVDSATFNKTLLQYLTSLKGWDDFKIPSPEVNSKICKLETSWFEDLYVTNEPSAANFKIEPDLERGIIKIISGSYQETGRGWKFIRAPCKKESKPTILRRDLLFLNSQNVNRLIGLTYEPLTK